MGDVDELSAAFEMEVTHLNDQPLALRCFSNALETIIWLFVTLLCLNSATDAFLF